ncbi:MAG: hypothetical protein JZD40_05475 [Sulfolobus sp.]|nr:hypothetical protein [Sulfolobus sp.]
MPIIGGITSHKGMMNQKAKGGGLIKPGTINELKPSDIPIGERKYGSQFRFGNVFPTILIPSNTKRKSADNNVN